MSTYLVFRTSRTGDVYSPVYSVYTAPKDNRPRPRQDSSRSAPTDISQCSIIV